jgi:hypothetical protein
VIRAILSISLLLASGAAVEPRGRVVFSAPPGTDATTLAHATKVIAERLRLLGCDVAGDRCDVSRGRVEILLRESAASAREELAACIEHTGALRVVAMVEPDTLLAGAEDEREGMLQWRGMYPEADAEQFRATPAENGGPSPILLWFEDSTPRRPWIGCNGLDALDAARSFTETDVVLSADGCRVTLQVLEPQRERWGAYATSLGSGRVALVDDERVVRGQWLASEVREGSLEWSLPMDARGCAALRDVWSVSSKSGRLTFRPRLVEVR